MPSKPMFWTRCMIGNKFLFQHFWLWGLLFRNNEASLMAQWWIICQCRREKEMTTHSSVLACRIPGTVEPGGLPSMGSHRVRHDWSDLAVPAAMQEMQEMLVRFLGWENPLEKEMATHSSVLAWRIPGTGSLVGCHLWGRTESDTTEAT